MRIREMTPGDAHAVAGLRVRGWRHAYAGMLPQAYLDAMSVADDAARREKMLAEGSADVTHLVAEDSAGRVCGWASVGPLRGEGRTSGDGELYALYVEPELIGSGVGRALVTEVLARAGGRGYGRLLLWVLEANTRARRFYERAGFTPDGAREYFDAGGTLVPEVRYVRRGQGVRSTH